MNQFGAGIRGVRRIRVLEMSFFTYNLQNMMKSTYTMNNPVPAKTIKTHDFP